MIHRKHTEPPRKWVRVRLAAPPHPDYPDRPGLTEGELVLRADGVSQGDEHVTFFVGDEEVFQLKRSYYRNHAWFVDRPTFGEWLRERRAQYENQGRAWTADEDVQLLKEITDELPWRRISDRHGRSISAVRRRATVLRRPGTPEAAAVVKSIGESQTSPLEGN